MTLKEQICKAFCNGVSVRDVPMGLAISTPNLWLDGDKLVFYARRNGELIRFEDSGSSIFDLEASGVDTTSSTRIEIIQTLCADHGVVFNEDEVQFQTAWIKAEYAGFEAIRFMAFLTRLQDLIFTTKERVVRTFRDDLLAAIQREFANDATVSIGEAPIQQLAYYTVDIVVKHRDGQTAAIFPGVGEQKALEAILFAKEIELKGIRNIVPFLIIEESGSKISKHTKAKAMNSQMLMAAWDGGERDVLDKVRKNIQPITA